MITGFDKIGAQILLGIAQKIKVFMSLPEKIVVSEDWNMR